VANKPLFPQQRERAVYLFEKLEGEVDMSTSDKYKDIDKCVSKWVQGKYGRIGIIVPDRKPTRAEWEDLHITLAEIYVKRAPEKRDDLLSL
jgi:hypothetical protein